ICGGGPIGGQYDRYIGGALWQNPGAFANGFQGVCSVFITAAFAFFLLLVNRETPDPRATTPGTVKGTFWPTVEYSVFFFCVLSGTWSC
ncbi:hypothetical protein F5890DRAFT_1422541, partial [Lentinula detonsa]